MEFDDFYVSRRLARTIRRGAFEVTRDEDFAGVVTGCAEPRGDGQGTWITPELSDSLAELHEQGFAHSVEAWQDGQLAGGVYGLAIGGYFSAESMFFRRRDASKVSLAHLVEHLRLRGFELLDIQVLTDHLESLGATEIPRDAFLTRLAQAIVLRVTF